MKNITDLITNEKLKQFGEDYIKILIDFIKKSHKVSTGKLINSVNSKIVKETEQIKIIIESEDYLNYIDKGRKSGSYPPIREIAKWAKVKGISPKAVFPISKSIYKFGIKPTNIIDKTINKITSNTRDIEDEIAKNTEIYIKQQLEK